MPFPWKKNKVTRITRIVADLQSPKHYSSLVVQTGFPTSLIDLFVKNRSRFAKPKSSKPLHPQISDPPPTAELPPAPSPMPETSSSSFGRDEDDVGVAGSAPDVNRVSGCGCGSGSKPVFATLVKLLLVVFVLLITSVKNLTVGITVSAFAFMSIENAGKRLVSFLRPCSDSKMGAIMEPLNWFWFQEKLLQLNSHKWDCQVSGSEASSILKGGKVVDGDEFSSISSSEITEVLETKTCLVVGGELDLVKGDKKSSCPEMLQEEEEGEEGDSCKISPSVKFKSKMVKKLVPKKLRNTMKERKKKKSTPSSSLEMVNEQENGNGSAMSSLPEIKQDGVNVIREYNNRGIHKIGDSGYMTLFAIALAGLVLGRFPALILTMTWCFMLNIVSYNSKLHQVPSSIILFPRS